ncbi:MAG: ATP-binding cassette domain-containing protein [Firmicutes bacterium]|nr:ATP-binding cassette domain-containing protein [Bacillota bacterium]
MNAETGKNTEVVENKENKENKAEVLVKADNIKQYFDVKLPNGKKASLKAVNGVSFEIGYGEIFGLVGESGCGKSTLGKTLLKTYPLTDGSIYFDGEDISNIKGAELKEFRAKTQMIFQDPSSCLNPRRRVRDILLEPYVIHELFTQEEREEKIGELCDMVGLSRAYLDRYPHEMSGGQKQRVGIARALALRPKLIVCDEPVSALDVSIQAQVINLLQDLQQKLGLTYLFISHNLSVVKHCCDRIGVMYLGEMVELADSDRIYENPLHPYTRALISAIPDVETGGGTERIILSGDLPSPTALPEGCTFNARCPECMEICRSIKPEQKEIEPGHFVSCHIYDNERNKKEETR